jgi:bifunctional DNA-binding transcriptional regulator/antitoxin component of YhaV-PrlF toxin-antitoxin module
MCGSREAGRLPGMSRVKTVPSSRLEAEIFKHLDLESGDPLVLIEGGDFVLVKRATTPSLVERFDKLATETEERFEQSGIEQDEVERAVRWARDSS